MPKAPRIFNINRGFYLKRSQVERAIENCAVTWVEHGVSVRDLTLAEAIQARNEQARQREPLAMAELHGVCYEPTTAGKEQTQRGFALVREANALCGA